jgi:hypothetical protein
MKANLSVAIAVNGMTRQRVVVRTSTRTPASTIQTGQKLEYLSNQHLGPVH